MALIIALVLLLMLSAGVVVTWQYKRQRQSASDLQGFWEGTIAIRHVKLRGVLKVQKSPDGTYTAAMDSIDQGAANVPINAMTLSNGMVRFEVPSARGRFIGTLNARGTEVAGEWQQGGTKVPVSFKRTQTPSTIPEPLPASAYARRESSPLQGVWKATLEVGVPIRIVVRVSETATGKYNGTMDSPDQGARNIPLTTAAYAKPTARFHVASIDGHFEGTLNEDGSAIDGTWTQGANSIPCLLTRADPAEDAAPDASAYAFASDTELQGIWKGTLETGRSKLRLLLKIARVTNDTYRATIDSLDQGMKDLPASMVSFNGTQVMVEWPALRALFHGELEKGKLVGFWQQGSTDLPIEFERTNRVADASAPKKN
jgi:hypothetical protein